MSRIDGEEKEEDIFYSEQHTQTYDCYEEDEDVEYIDDDGDIDDDVQSNHNAYELYDEELDPQLQLEADSIMFLEDDGQKASNTQQQQSSSTTTVSSSSSTTKTTTSTTNNNKNNRKSNQSQSQPRSTTPGISIKLHNHLAHNIPTLTTNNTDLPRHHAVEIGSTLRNTKTTAVTATTQIRLAKENVVALNQSLTSLTKDLNETLKDILWLDRFVIEPQRDVKQSTVSL